MKVLIVLFNAVVALSLCHVSCIPDDKLKIPFNMEPTIIDDGLIVSDPQSEGMDPEKLHQAYEHFFQENEYIPAISLLVGRNSRLVGEGYCRNINDRFIGEQIQSATKSITSLVFGVAMNLGYIGSLEQTLYTVYPHWFDTDPKKRVITMRHLLTMRSGIDFRNGDFALNMISERHSNQTQLILKRPLYNDPGAEFLYRDADPQLLSSAIQYLSGKTLEEIARGYLFDPMEITDFRWESNVDGESFGPFGILMRPRDLMKIGMLVQNEGNWQGHQLVPREWIQASTSFQTYPDSSKDRYQGLAYGYYWWIVPELDAVTAWGHGGNFIFIVPTKNLVIVFTAEPDTAYDSVEITLREFLPLAKMILDSIIDQSR
jgi:CubicO group peptidase (beta-lactamase class C family)